MTKRAPGSQPNKPLQPTSGGCAGPQWGSLAIARENRDKYKKEGHEVEYVELPGQGHLWGTKSGINETIWKFFAAHPRKKE